MCFLDTPRCLQFGDIRPGNFGVFKCFVETRLLFCHVVRTTSTRDQHLLACSQPAPRSSLLSGRHVHEVSPLPADTHVRSPHEPQTNLYRPPVVRTYGRSTRPGLGPAPSSSSSTSMVFASSSSPPSSPRLVTPHASSDLDLDLDISPNALDGPSPILARAAGKQKQQEKENVPVLRFDHHQVEKPKTKAAVQSTLGSFFSRPPPNPAGPSKKRPFDTTSTSGVAVKRPPPATQMHLTHLPLLHTCQQCHMSYVRGGEDEGTHERHHASVTRGIVWDGLGKGKAKARAVAGNEAGKGYKVVKDCVDFGTKGKGKIIAVEGSYGGAKVCLLSHNLSQAILCSALHSADLVTPQLDEITRTVDTVLSSPPLSPAILDQCKIFLFVTASPAPTKRLRPGFSTERIPKERVVAVVVAQGIKWAMRVLRPDESGPKGVGSGAGVRVVDSGEGVLCE